MEFTLDASQRMVRYAASTDESRPVLKCVHIRKGIIEAADGYILVQKEIDYDGEESLLIRASDLVKCKGDTVSFSKDEGTMLVAKGKETDYFSPQEGTFHDVDKLYPGQTGRKVMDRLKGERGVFHIAISRKNLLKVLKTLDTDIIRFYFYGVEKAVEFEAAGARGLIMPVSWEEE